MKDEQVVVPSDLPVGCLKRDSRTVSGLDQPDSAIAARCTALSGQPVKPCSSPFKCQILTLLAGIPAAPRGLGLLV